MKTTKTLLAVSILAAAGAASAATYTATETVEHVIYDNYNTEILSPPSVDNGTGQTAVLNADKTALDIDINQLNVKTHYPFNLSVPLTNTTTTVHVHLVGTVNGNTFTPTSGTSQVTQCTDDIPPYTGEPGCIPPVYPDPIGLDLDSVTGTLNVDTGVYSITSVQTVDPGNSGNPITTTVTYSNQ